MSRSKRGVRQVRGGARNTSKPEGVYLSFYCRGTESSPHEKWRIGTVFPEDWEGGFMWDEYRPAYLEEASDHLIKVFPPITQWLDGDEYVPRSEGRVSRPAVDSGTEHRRVWNLRCKRCSYSRRIGHPAKLYDLLNDLADLGVREISLRAFVSRVEAAKGS